MGQITISATTGQGSLSRTFNISDADVNRITDWAQVYFLDAGETSLTKTNAFRRWAAWLIERTRARVTAHEQQAAAITPITVSDPA